MIKGQTVYLHETVQTGVDAFNAPIYEETLVAVPNVLIGEPSTDDIVSATDLFGKRLIVMLGIPKGDTHDWIDKTVSWTDALGRECVVKTFGWPIVGIEANVPGPWHAKVRCAAYE